MYNIDLFIMTVDMKKILSYCVLMNISIGIY